jgi:WD40 repeat protein
MPRRFLNIQYSGIKTEIDVTDFERFRQVQDAIKAELCNNLALVDSPQLLLYSNSSKEKLINTWDLINYLTQEYFIEGGSCVIVGTSKQTADVWLQYLDEDPVRIRLADNEMLIYELKLSFISLLNSPLSSASPGSIMISLNSTVIPSNKAVSDFIDQISYEIPFLVSVHSIGIHEEHSGISAPTATEKTDMTDYGPIMTNYVPISKKRDADGKAPLFNFNPNSSVGKFQTGSGFQSKGFDFGVTDIPKTSTAELKNSEIVESFYGSFKGHSNFIIDIALSQDHLYSCSGDKTIKKWDLNTGKTVLTFGGLFGVYTTVYTALSVAGDYIYSTSLDKLITKWDPVTGKKVFDFKVGASQSMVASGPFLNQSVVVSGPFLTISVYNDYLYAVSSNGTVFKFEVNAGHCIAAFGRGDFSLTLPLRQIMHVFKDHVAVAYQNQISLFKNDGEAVSFTLPPLQAQQAILFGSQASRNAWFFTVSGDYLYACHALVINKYHIKKKEHILSFEGHTDCILSLVVSGSFLFTSSKDNTIKKWDIDSGANLATICGHLNPVNCLQVSDNFLYSGSSDCLIKKWNFDLELDKGKNRLLA